MPVLVWRTTSIESTAVSEWSMQRLFLANHCLALCLICWSHRSLSLPSLTRALCLCWMPDSLAIRALEKPMMETPEKSAIRAQTWANNCPAVMSGTWLTTWSTELSSIRILIKTFLEQISVAFDRFISSQEVMNRWLWTRSLYSIVWHSWGQRSDVRHRPISCAISLKQDSDLKVRS